MMGINFRQSADSTKQTIDVYVPNKEMEFKDRNLKQ